MFAAAPVLVSTAKFLYSSRGDMLNFLKHLPRLCLAEVKYLVAGIEPDLPVVLMIVVTKTWNNSTGLCVLTPQLLFSPSRLTNRSRGLVIRPQGTPGALWAPGAGGNR